MPEKDTDQGLPTLRGLGREVRNLQTVSLLISIISAIAAVVGVTVYGDHDASTRNASR